ncbi:MAG: NUDIX domain-containing protein [Candidatus Vogelbacteria bacterium]|nr:NUDIX domain-containing protein [Candidatus Vogelbacteria bacterium]
MEISYKKVQVIIFRRIGNRVEILLLQRASDETWQPVTGGVEEGESYLNGATRETIEETGLTLFVKIVEGIYSFSFKNPEGHRRAGLVTEEVFAFEAPISFKPTLSQEHINFMWVSPEEAVKKLKFENQKMAMNKFILILKFGVK